MASAGRLHVSIEARVEKLEEGLARADRRVQQTTARMKSLGETASAAASRGLRTMAAAMGAVGAAAAAQERSWATLGATILASFAAGGPIAGGIALVGAAVGLLIGKTKDASAATDEYAKRWEEAGRKARSAAESAAEKLDRMKLERDLPDSTDAQRRIILLQVEVEKLTDAVRSGNDALLPTLIARSDELDALREIADLEAEAAASAKRRAEELKNIAAAVADMSRRTVALPRPASPWLDTGGMFPTWATMTEVQRSGGRVDFGGPMERHVGGPAGPGEMNGPWWPGAIQLPEGFGVPAGMFGTTGPEPIPPQFVAALEAQWEDISRGLKFTLRDSIADGLLDAFLTGADNLKEILGAAAIDVSRMLLRAGVGAGMHALGIPMFAAGGTVMGPTLAILGEGGQAERVEPIHATGDTRNDHSSMTFNVYVSGGNPRDVVDALRHEMRGSNLRRALRAGGF